jgi:large subunit ribosomal protein L23
MYTTIILKPRVSEKAYGQSGNDAKSGKANVYVFDVDGSQTKQSVASAVKAQYKVEVTNVNIVNLKGKTKRTVRKGGRPIAGRTSDVKKAYVTLKVGESLPIFAAIEAETAKEEKATEQLSKAAEKAAAKEAAKEEKQAAKEAKKAEKAKKENK